MSERNAPCGSGWVCGNCADLETRERTRILASPLMTQYVQRDDEFSRGWNAACAALRSLIEQKEST